MRRDPLVEEIRKNRAAIAQEHGNDVDAIVAAFQHEDANGVATVSFPPKRVMKRVPRRKPAKTMQTDERRATVTAKRRSISRAARG